MQSLLLLAAVAMFDSAPSDKVETPGQNLSQFARVQASDDEERTGGIATCRPRIASFEPNPSSSTNRDSRRSWILTTVRQKPRKSPVESEGHAPASQLIQTPVKGRIIRWGKGVEANAHVQKGQLIVEIFPNESEQRDRLQAQQIQVTDQLEAARLIIEASERNLMATRKNVDALAAQRDAQQKVNDSFAAAAEGMIATAKNKVDAELAALEATKAVREQMKAAFAQQKELFADNTLSKAKFQQIEAKLKQSEAEVRRAEASADAAKNELTVQRNLEDAKLAQQQVEVERATASVALAEREQVQAEVNLTKAKLELRKSERSLKEIQNRLARKQSLLIEAPFSGTITKLSSATILQEGDTICVIEPDEVPSKAITEHQATDPHQPVTAELPLPLGSVGLVSVIDLEGSTPLRMALPVQSISALRQHLNGLTARLQQGGQSAASGQTIAVLQQQLAAAKDELATITSVLEIQLQAARKLHESQVAFQAQIEQRYATGDLNPFERNSVTEALIATRARIRQLEQLHQYFHKLSDDSRSESLDEKQLLTTLLQIRLEAAHETYQLLSDVGKIVRQRFTLGEGSTEEVIQAQQAELAAETDVKMLERLLKDHQPAAPNSIEE